MRLLLALLAALFATPAFAQTEPPPPTPPGQRAPQPAANLIAEPVGLMIAGFDSDGDTRVTRAEFDVGLRRAFDDADPRKTGSIGYLAYADWAEKWLGDKNALPGPFECDKNGDNRISFEEFADRFDLFFTRFDLNADGVLVRSELVTLRPTRPMVFTRDRREEQRQQQQ